MGISGRLPVRGKHGIMTGTCHVEFQSRVVLSILLDILCVTTGLKLGLRVASVS